MTENLNNSGDQLRKYCDDAFIKYPKSCSHSVWHVIRQYIADQPYMIANMLIDHISSSPNWQEVQPNELSKLASDGILVVGGLKESGHGHVIAVYPGSEKARGGYSVFNRSKMKTEVIQEKGSYARAMSTSIGSWPGAMSNGDKTVWDPWGNDKKFNNVRFWKYAGSTTQQSPTASSSRKRWDTTAKPVETEPMPVPDSATDRELLKMRWLLNDGRNVDELSGRILRPRWKPQ